MRTVAKFALESAVDETSGPALADTITALSARWLEHKGDIRDGCLLVLQDGREANISREEFKEQGCGLSQIQLSEPTSYGSFETHLAYGYSPIEFGFSCRLRTGASGKLVGPIHYEVKVPGLVRAVIAAAGSWTFRGQLVPSAPVRMLGRVGGEAVAEEITRLDRALPIVVVSEDNGLPLQPDLEQQLSYDLVSLASVVSLDSEASWALTEAIGERFSCFGGAVRLYWPGVDPAVTNPYNHPLWTPLRLMDGAANTQDASERLRRTLRRRILGISALTVQDPEVLSTVVDRQRSARLSHLQKQLRDVEDYSKLAEIYAQENARLQEELRVKDGELRDLRLQLRNHQETLRHWPPSAVPTEEVLPEREEIPRTVAEAVQRATREFQGALVFGEDVDKGIAGLDPQAGPPDKVYRYLVSLGEFARQRRCGPVGTSTFEWFRQRNVSASDESENLSKGEKLARTWHDGTGRRVFVWHLKPAEAVAPDRCTRIYFDWDDQRKVVAVGWVGRHP
jgi:hypothetical protein